MLMVSTNGNYQLNALQAQFQPAKGNTLLS